MTPLVSVLTPTFNRPELLRRALAAFQAYTYPRKEWIVVDDSPRPATGIQGPGVRYLHLRERLVLGQKHNIAAALAQGEILVHRDDDDIFSPRSLVRQIEPIALGEVSMTGFRINYLREEPSGKFFHFRGDAKFIPSNPTTLPLFKFHDSTAAFSREVLAAGIQYSAERVCQKVHFLNDAVRAGFSWRALGNVDDFVYTRHAVNTWAFDRAKLVEQDPPAFARASWFLKLTRRAA